MSIKTLDYVVVKDNEGFVIDKSWLDSGIRDQYFDVIRLTRNGWALSGGYSTSSIKERIPVSKRQRRVYFNLLRKEFKFWENSVQRLGFYVGTDPEMFVVDKTGKLVPPSTFLEKKTGNYAISYPDGCGAEFMTAPTTCLAYGVDNIQSGLRNLYNKALEKEYSLTLKNVFELTDEQRATFPAEALELGCRPSFNAYHEQSPLEGVIGQEVPIRSAGGHIHFGKTLGTKQNERTDTTVKCMDVIVGVPAVSMAAGIDRAERRNFYGRAGEYRLPKHGLEYRVLSNFWLIHPAITHLTFELARIGFSVGLSNNALLLEDCFEEARDIINNNDVNASRQFITKHRALYEGMLFNTNIKSLGRDKALHGAYKMILNGALSLISLKDFEKSWRLECGWISHSGVAEGTWASFAQRNY